MDSVQQLSRKKTNKQKPGEEMTDVFPSFFLQTRILGTGLFPGDLCGKPIIVFYLVNIPLKNVIEAKIDSNYCGIKFKIIFINRLKNSFCFLCFKKILNK